MINVYVSLPISINLMKFPTVSVINSNLCAFGGPEGLTTVFGQFEGVEQDKIGGKSRNRGEHAEKRDLKLFAYMRPTKGGKNFC